VLYGYATRDGKAFRELVELITKNSNQKLPLMLRLHLQEGLQSKDGLLIEQIVSPSWFLIDFPEVKIDDR
jgi:hypothetical protein